VGDLSAGNSWVQISPEALPGLGDSVVVDVVAEPVNMFKFNFSVGYPPEAKEAGIQGTVLVKILVSKHGEVLDSKLISSPGKLLTDPVMQKLPLLKFSPAIKDGKPVASWTTAPFRYKLS
jgi:TonB family protein